MRADNEEEARRWLTQAEDELRDARMLLEQTRYYLALYLCQQSAEKALKAFLYFRDQGPLLTHSVTSLIELASQLDSSFEKLSDAKRLDDYYIPTRYPNGLPGGVPSRYFTDPVEVTKALAVSSSVLDTVRARILMKAKSKK